MAVTTKVRAATGSLDLRATYFESPDKLFQELEELFKPTAERKRGKPGKKPRLGLSTSQAAAALGVSLGTVERWADMGFLEPYRTPKGHRRFRVEQIEQFLKQLGRRGSEGRHEPPQPNLRDVAAAVAQTERYIRCAEILTLNWPADLPPQAADARLKLSSPAGCPYRVVTIRMGSPLEIVLRLPSLAWPPIALGLVMLAERICTFGPRVSQKRKRDLLEATIYQQAQQELLAGRADGLALGLLSEGPAEGPTHIDFLDPEAPSDEQLRGLERGNSEDDQEDDEDS